MSEPSATSTILAFVPDLWDEPWMSRHHVLRGLSHRYKVLWVSPPTYWSKLRGGQARATLSSRGLRRVSDTLWAYAPTIPADYARHYSQRGLPQRAFRCYAAAWDALFIRHVKHLLRRMGTAAPILYLWRPEFAKYVGRFGEQLVCYHIVDEYTFNPAVDEPISPEEMALLKDADLVFIHSKTLLQKKGHINPHTHYVPNGVDYAHFQQVLARAPEPPPDLSPIPQPRIGYIGHIKRHLDLPLLCRIAQARPDWSLVLVGLVREEHRDIERDVAALRAQPNVHFLGAVPPAELPRYISGFDVCLMPYRQTPYTKYIYPLKLHEYLACGKPVVATPLPNLLEFSHVLHLAEDLEAWLQAIAAALDESDPALPAQRMAVARENSWEGRVDGIATLFEHALRRDWSRRDGNG